MIPTVLTVVAAMQVVELLARCRQERARWR